MPQQFHILFHICPWVAANAYWIEAVWNHLLRLSSKFWDLWCRANPRIPMWEKPVVLLHPNPWVPSGRWWGGKQPPSDSFIMALDIFRWSCDSQATVCCVLCAWENRWCQNDLGCHHRLAWKLGMFPSVWGGQEQYVLRGSSFQWWVGEKKWWGTNCQLLHGHV